MKTPRTRQLIASALWASAGCVPIERIPQNPAYLPDPTPEHYDDGHWARVLEDNVHAGQVDYANLAQNREPLERFLGLISVVGPESTPNLFRTPSDKICYYINAYNACVLRAVLKFYPAPELQRVDAPRLEHQFVFDVDGRDVRLSQIRELLEEVSEGDMRVHFCISQAALGSPKLSGHSYRPNELREQMRQAVQDALQDPYLIRVDEARRQIFLWMVLIEQREKFIAFYQRISGSQGGDVISFLSLFADQPTRRWLEQARGYRELRMPINRRLNDLKPTRR